MRVLVRKTCVLRTPETVRANGEESASCGGGFRDGFLNGLKRSGILHGNSRSVSSRFSILVQGFLTSSSGVDLPHADTQLRRNGSVRHAFSPHPDRAANVQGDSGSAQGPAFGLGVTQPGTHTFPSAIARTRPWRR